MTPAASVEGRERLRLFCALTLPEDVLDRVEAWQREELSGLARLVPREHLHITLAFLGSRPAEEVATIAAEVRAVAAPTVEAPVLRAARYRETRSVGMLVLGDEEERAGRFALEVQTRLERLAVYRPEARAWLPHVTVLRFQKPPRLHPSVPDLGTFSPSGAAVYHSVLRSGGAQYEVLDSVGLGG